MDIYKRYRGVVKNITVSLDDETYRRARIKAAELNKSVSSLVREFLIDMATTETETERLKRDIELVQIATGRLGRPNSSELEANSRCVVGDRRPQTWRRVG